MPLLSLQVLDGRDLPAVSLDLVYLGDVPDAVRGELRAAAGHVAQRLAGGLAALDPGPIDTWRVSYFNPAGDRVYVDTGAVPADTIRVYVQWAELPGGEIGRGGQGGFVASGTTPFLDALTSRSWGGAVTLDSGYDWSPGVAYTAATHELLHVLGYGSGATWDAHVSGWTFAADGVTVPLSGDGGHAHESVPDTLMTPTLTAGPWQWPSESDWAVIAALGWELRRPEDTPILGRIAAVTPVCGGR